MLNAVLFDLDNTLVDRDGAFRGCLQTLCLNPRARAELTGLDRGGRGDRGELFQFWERHTGTAIDQSTFGHMIAGQLKPDCGLIIALENLAKVVKLGIITNGNGETQREKCQAAGLDQVIPAHRIWISGEIGIAKPDPGIFLLACQALGENPEHCLFVGDNENDDFLAAKNAGMRSCLVESALNAGRLRSLLNRERSR
jgi:putative hydrolase of the HAD superfamily